MFESADHTTNEPVQSNVQPSPRIWHGPQESEFLPGSERCVLQSTTAPRVTRTTRAARTASWGSCLFLGADSAPWPRVLPGPSLTASGFLRQQVLKRHCPVEFCGVSPLQSHASHPVKSSWRWPWLFCPYGFAPGMSAHALRLHDHAQLLP